MPVYRLNEASPERPEDAAHWIAPSADVIGRVALGTNSSIWFGAVLRGDNEPIEVGDGSNVQDLCIIHTDPGFPARVGQGCTIGHRAILHGCTVGDGSLIGMGAIVLNGAVVGENCLVGAGALVPEGRAIPDRSLVVGMPAKVVRTLEDAEVRQLREAADVYVAKWQRYAAGMTAV